MRLRTLLNATLVLLLSNSMFGQRGLQDAAQPSKPVTLAQVWTFDAIYTDQQHGVTFRYPSVWAPTTQTGYHPPALTASDEKPIAGFGYEEGGFPRDRVVGPYSATNLEGFGIVYTAVSTVGAAECEAKASSISGTLEHRVVTLDGRSFSERETAEAGMSQYVSGKLYATYMHHICYLFETDVAAHGWVGPDDRVRALTPLQMRVIDTHLLDIMKSVRIVPPAQPQVAEPVVSDDLATATLKLGKSTYRIGEPVEVTVTLAAGKNGVYLPNYFKDWLSTCRDGLRAFILTDKGKPAGEGAHFACMGNDAYGAGVTPESEFHNFVYLQPGETRIWKSTILTTGIRGGSYTVFAEYLSYARLIEEVAKLPQSRGLVAIGHITAKPIAIHIR